MSLLIDLTFCRFERSFRNILGITLFSNTVTNLMLLIEFSGRGTQAQIVLLFVLFAIECPVISTLLVNMFHPDLRNGKIKSAVMESIRNIRHCSCGIRKEIESKRKVTYFYWFLLSAIVMVANLYSLIFFINDFSLLHCYPLNNVLQDVTFINWFIILPTIAMVSAIFGYSLMIPVSLGIYVTFHEWLQFLLLNDYLKRNLWTRQNNDELFSERQQRIIYRKIRKSIRWHLHLKRMANSILGIQDVYMMVLCPSGLLAFVAALYFLISGINPNYNLEIIFLLISIISYLVIECIVGQTTTDEFAKLNLTLYGCSWYYWNRQNRSALLIMLANTIQPFRNSCFGLIHLDYELILKSARISYSMMTVALKLKI